MAENGRLPASALSRIYHPTYEVYLDREAAAGWNTFCLWLAKTDRGRPYPTGQDSAYRTYDRQVYFWDLYQRGLGNLAAVPGTSNHGWGKAIDLAAMEFRNLVDAHGASFGWGKVEAWSEWWHVNWIGGFNRPDPGIDLENPIARKGSGGKGQDWYVRKLQRLLRANGFKVRVSGGFGLRTRRQVKRFQKHVNLKPDGVVGPKTWNRLKGQAGK